MEVDQYPLVWFPSRLSILTKGLTFTWVLLIILDVGAMIVNIMAYTGAQGPDDRYIIKHTWITFSTVGNHVQRTMIAMPCIGIIMHFSLPILVSIWVGRLRRDYTAAHTKQVRLRVILVPLLYHVLSLAAWAVLIAFQTEYVPILGTNKLPECVRFGDELSQCGMLTGSWILGMVICVAHLITVVLLVLMVKWLSYPKDESMALNPAAAPTQRGNSPPPASTQTRRSGPVPYYAILPPDAETSSTTPSPSYKDQASPPPYSEAKAA